MLPQYMALFIRSFVLGPAIFWTNFFFRPKIFLNKNCDCSANFENFGTFFRQHAASIYGFVHQFRQFRQFRMQKKICVSVRWVTLWVRPRPCENTCVCSLGAIVGASPPLCEYMFVCSLGYIVGASPPRVCPFIGRQCSLDPSMLPTPLCGIFFNHICHWLSGQCQCYGWCMYVCFPKITDDKIVGAGQDQ